MSKIKLTEAEQFIMEVIWSKEKAFMKDIMEAYDDPKPASTTLATVLKRMQDKNLVGYETVGNSRQYYSLVKKEQYFSGEMQSMMKKFFNNSVSQFASYFTANAKLSQKQLKELRDMIDLEIEKRQKDG